MNIKDLGNKTGKILVFGGPTSNYCASKKILEIAKEQNILPDNIICTGDMVAYCAQPEETAQLLYKSKIHIIKGNCEESLANDIDNCGCGFEEETTCNLLSKQWYDFSRVQTSVKMKQWMATLPDRIIFKYMGKKFHVLHGSHRSINEFIFKSSAESHKRSEIDQIDADVVLCGHSGIPFTSVIDDKIWHNAGSIGMPANDGTNRTWYSIISTDGSHISFEHYPLTYDYLATAKVMINNGLTEYAHTIQNGLWPSIDILPEDEQSQTGHELCLESVKI